jgi:integrase
MRKPKPYLRKQTKTWYLQLGKRQIRLSQNKEEAFQKYHEIMLNQSAYTSTLTNVLEVLDHYLEWLQNNRAEGTYTKAKHYLTDFAKQISKTLKITNVQPYHLTQWVDGKPDWVGTTKNDAISTVQRAFRWAAKQGLIHQNPVPDVQKPRKTSREIYYNSDDWKKIKEHLKGEFGDLINFCFETGCRPMEARTLQAHQVDLERHMAVFPPSENKTHLGPRVIFLNDAALEIVNRLATEGLVFRNANGDAWTKDSIKCRFQRLKDKVGIERLIAYGFRHTYITDALKNGIDSVTLAQLVGHADTSMISKVYGHLAKNPEYLLAQAKKAR